MLAEDDMPVPEVIVQRHLHELRQLGRTEGTIWARDRAIARMAELIAVPLLEATEDDLRAWRAGLDLHVTSNTVVHYASHARQFFAWAVREGLCESNPADALLIPVLVRGLPRPIGEEPLLLAIAAAPGQIRCMLVLAAWAGLRAKEIALLRRERVLDTARPPVLLIAADATKGRRERVVPMSSFVRDELRLLPLPRAGWVFRRRDGRPGPNSPARVSRLCCKHLHDCEIPETLHQLRHRFGTVGYRVSKDLRALQEVMGHARPETTAGYTAYHQAAAIEMVEAMPAPLHLQSAAG